MNRKDLITNTVNRLKELDARKPVVSPRHTFHISDNEGNHKDFVVKMSKRTVGYTAEDVSVMLEAMLDVVCDALRKGDNISVLGIGTLGLNYRKPRTTKMPGTNDTICIAGHYLPKLQYGKRLRLAAKLYELSLDGLDMDEESYIDEDYDEDLFGSLEDDDEEGADGC